MYGTTMKNYNSSKSYKEEKTSVYQKKNAKMSKALRENTPKTRYMKINERRIEPKAETTSSFNVVKEDFSRKEFPIASVIFTAIATMILLLLTTGVLG